MIIGLPFCLTYYLNISSKIKLKNITIQYIEILQT